MQRCELLVADFEHCCKHLQLQPESFLACACVFICNVAKRAFWMWPYSSPIALHDFVLLIGFRGFSASWNQRAARNFLSITIDCCVLTRLRSVVGRIGHSVFTCEIPCRLDYDHGVVLLISLHYFKCLTRSEFPLLRRSQQIVSCVFSLSVFFS